MYLEQILWRYFPYNDDWFEIFSIFDPYKFVLLAAYIKYEINYSDALDNKCSQEINLLELNDTFTIQEINLAKQNLSYDIEPKELEDYWNN